MQSRKDTQRDAQTTEDVIPAYRRQKRRSRSLSVIFCSCLRDISCDKASIQPSFRRSFSLFNLQVLLGDPCADKAGTPAQPPLNQSILPSWGVQY